MNFLLKYKTIKEAVVAAKNFEEEFLEVKNIGDLRSPIKFNYKTSSCLKAAAKRKVIEIKSCYARLKDNERAAEIAAQIVNRGSGWQNSFNERGDKDLKFTFIKVNNDGTCSVYLKAYPIREEVPFKTIAYINLKDNRQHELAGPLAPALFKTANYLQSKLKHSRKDVPFVNINIGDLEL